MSDSGVQASATPVDPGITAVAVMAREVEADVARMRKQIRRVWGAIVVLAALTVTVAGFSFAPRLLGGGPGGAGFQPPTGAAGSISTSQTAPAQP